MLLVQYRTDYGTLSYTFIQRSMSAQRIYALSCDGSAATWFGISFREIGWTDTLNFGYQGGEVQNNYFKNNIIEVCQNAQYCIPCQLYGIKD